MGKLKVMVAVFGLMLGLASAAQAGLYTYDGTVQGITINNVNQPLGTGLFHAEINTVGPSDNTVTGISLNFGGVLTKIFNASDLTSFQFKQFVPGDYLFFSRFINGGTETISLNNLSSGYQQVTASLKYTTGYATPTPIPAAAWLLGSGLLGMLGLKRRKNEA